MRHLVIAPLIFFGALVAETMLDASLPSATAVRETRASDVPKKKQIKKQKKPNQPKQARRRDESLPPNLGPGIGLGL
jgi:hypothetical protein